jgi:phosphatidate cytidylyltransferase
MHLLKNLNFSELSIRVLTGSILLCALWLFFSIPALLQMIILLSLLAYVLYAEWPSFRQANLTLFYPVLPGLCWALLTLFPQELNMMIIAVAMQDIGAYFGGLFFGRHLLAPSISPRKTCEGLISGILSAITIVVAIFATPETIITTGLFAFTCALLGAAGDLFESYLKRKAHLKDSGAILPGHGGILDRIDGYLGAAPFILLLCITRLWIF